MIRRRSLRFTFASGLIFAGLSLSPEASAQPAPADPAQPSQPAPADPAQPSQPAPPAEQPSQPAPAPPAEQPSQPAPAPPAAQPSQPAPAPPANPAPRLQPPPRPPVHALQLAPTSTPPPASPPAPAPAAPATAPPSPYAPTMQAGGLAPPPPMDEKTAQTPSTPPTEPLKTEQEEEEEKDEDSGRGLSWVWANAEGGFQHVGLQTFNVDEQDFTAGFIETTGTGAAVGVGVGVRLLFITLGVRGRLGLLDSWQYFTAGGELGFRFPLGNLEPHFELGGGYAAVGTFSDSLLGDTEADVSIRGFYARPSAGIDYFITPVLSIGASASWEFMAMTRPGLSVTSINAIRESPSFDDAQKARADVLSAEGSGYGSAVTFTGVIGLHL